MHTLKCRSCAGQIVADEDKDVQFCPYCGTAISDDVKKFSYKIDIKSENNKTITHRNITKEKEQRNDHIQSICMLLVVFAILAGFVFIGISERNEHNAVENTANQALIAVQQELDAGNYDTALIKADLIRWTGDNKDKDSKEKWDREREVMIKLIKEAQKEAGK